MLKEKTREMTIHVWHKDGIGDTLNSPFKDVKVYRNGELATTDGKHENLVIILK